MSLLVDEDVILVHVHFGVLGVLHGVAHPKHLAGHLTLLPMTAEVLLHVRLLFEALSTHRAGERSFPGVNPPVLSKVVSRCKLFSTNWTIQHRDLQHRHLGQWRC